MFWSNKRNRRSATIVGAIIGSLIIFTFVLSLVAPGLRSDDNDDEPYATVTPFGTPPPPTPVILPTPDPDPQLEGEPSYIHSTGYFQTFRPAGTDWFIDEGTTDPTNTRLSTVIQSAQRLVVIHTFIKQGVEFETLGSLSDNYLTPEYYASEWSRYESWQETNRQVTDESVIVDFSLVSDTNDYLGREINWFDSGWLYVLRLVVPGNNPPLLDQLQALVHPAFVGYRDLQQLPPEWPAYVDQQLGFALKHAPGWQPVAGSVGRPTTFSSPDNQTEATIRLSTEADHPVESEDQAETWTAEAEPTATILGSAPIERENGSGYQVAYTYQDADGDPHSGLVVLLNDAAGTLYVANLRYDPPELNLLDAGSLLETEQSVSRMVTEGFIILPDIARISADTTTGN